MRYLVECLEHSAIILEFYITYDIILICLTGDCFINKRKLRDPLTANPGKDPYKPLGKFLPNYVIIFQYSFQIQWWIGNSTLNL